MSDILLYDTIYGVKPDALKAMGLRLLMLDLDNTLATYAEKEPSYELCRWAEELKLGGVTLFIISNNRGRRPGDFALKLGIGYVRAAGKPSGKALGEVMRTLGVSPSDSAIMGDQFFTDALAAAAAGVTAILVRPISIKNPLHALRYALELPFRHIFGRRRSDVTNRQNTRPAG